MNIWKIATGSYRPMVGEFGKRFILERSNSLKSTYVYARTIYMCSAKSNGDKEFFKSKPVVGLCQSGCIGVMHTEAGKNLVDYLKAEIVEEQKSQKIKSLPSKLEDFSITADGAELEFKKQSQNETITLSMNVSHSVDADDTNSEEGYSGEMRSKPNFEIDITRNNTTLSFNCSYTSFMDGENRDDVYQIDEVAMFDGEWNEKNYSVAADILDENLYDLFITLLHEKGITNELMENISDIATYYEHSKYVDLLQRIQKFVSL